MTVGYGALGSQLLDEDFIQDPAPLYAMMHADGAVHAIGDTGFHAVSGWGPVQEAVGRVDDFSSNLTATIMRNADGSIGTFHMDGLGGPTHVLATADDPAHAIHRKMLLPQLAAKRIRTLEPLVRQTSELLWHQALREGTTVEWMSTLANRLPMMVVGRLIGVPDDDVDRLVAWGYASTQLLEGLLGPDELAAAGTAMMELSGYIAEHFDRAAANPGDNLLGDLATAHRTGEIGSLTAQIMMITLFSAGGESTASLIGSAVHVLVTYPDVQRQLRDEPNLITQFLEEVLRFEPPFRGHYRHVVRDCTLAGAELSAGSRLLLLWGAANRDPAQFSDPNTFRLDRPNARGHITFGKGVHFCVGAALARLEARIVIEDLLNRTDWVSAHELGPWLPSLLVRRLASLHLDVDG